MSPVDPLYHFQFIKGTRGAGFNFIMPGIFYEGIDEMARGYKR